MESTLFIGNLPHKWESNDVRSWIYEIAPELHTTGKPDCFWVQPKRGNRWLWHEVFKRYAHVHFDLVCSACKLLEEGTSRQLFFEGRRAIIYPAVKYDSLEWWYDSYGSMWMWKAKPDFLKDFRRFN